MLESLSESSELSDDELDPDDDELLLDELSDPELFFFDSFLAIFLDTFTFSAASDFLFSGLSRFLLRIFVRESRMRNFLLFLHSNV